MSDGEVSRLFFRTLPARTRSVDTSGVQPVSADHIDKIHRAYRLAVRDLRACYNPWGIVAGRLHFNAYWARDGFWALYGALALGDHDQASMHLDIFVRYQLPSGELPVRIEFIGHTLGAYHTRRVRPKALYRAGAVFAEPLDPTALFIVAAREYYNHTSDMGFCDRFKPAMDRAIGWLMRHDRDGDGLIENNYLAGWMDSILKKDKVFYLNVTYYEALRAAEALTRTLGLPDEAEEHRLAADRVYARLNAAFWNGRYFTDWIRGARRGGLSTDGNVLAMFFGMATEDQSRRILHYIGERGLDDGAPLRTCDPVYPLSQVFPFYILAGIPDYHRTLSWPWLGTLNAVNKGRLGFRDDAIADLSRIAACYLGENAVGEVYEPDGRPVARRFYQAEVPFAWNAGLYVYAVHELGLRDGPPA